MLRIRDIMNAPVISVAPNALIEEALDLMLTHSISGLPVVDENQRMVGLITEFDALMLLDERPEDFRLIEPVANFMTEEVDTIDEDEPLENAARLFWQDSIRRLPVVRDGELVGMVSRRDLVRVIRQERLQMAMQRRDFGKQTTTSQHSC
jgi:CBS domain-containing protein